MSNKFLFLGYNLPSEYEVNYPTSNSPISFNKDGSLLSCFEDDVWDLSPYSFRPTVVNEINFDKMFLDTHNKSYKKKLLYEAKLMIYGLMFCDTNSRSISVSSIIEAYYIIKVIVDVSCKNKILPSCFHKEDKVTFLFLDYYRNKTKVALRSFIKVMKRLANLSSFFINHNFSLTPNQFLEIESFKNKLTNSEVKQSLIIPTRIYSILISKQEEILYDYNNYREEIIRTFEIFMNFDRKLKFISNYRKNNKKFHEHIVSSGLSELFNKYGILNINKLRLFFFSLQELSIMSILLFSGMRISEVFLLPFNTFKKIIINAEEVCILNGYTSKLTKIGPMKTSWITSFFTENAIKLAQDLTKIYSVFYKVNLEEHDSFPLFFSPGCKNQTSIYNYPVRYKLSLNTAIKFFGFNLNIFETDLEEMRKTELLADLYDRKVEINKPFPLASHQFRRSLTVYASRSGLVQTPALKGQLKHITQDMTYYYGNNSNLVPNYIFDKTLIDSINEEKIIESLMNFKEDILDTVIPLFGAEGTRLQVAKDKENIPLFLTDIKETEQSIRNGSLSYRRTPLGGCSRREKCDKTAFLSITACISCRDAVFSSRSITALVKTKQNFIAQSNSLDDENIYKKQLLLEIDEIEKLLSTYNNRIGVKNVSEID
ncbi:hypothetical protein KPE82_08280 [Acinetobacter baumannii]|uniref:hypothetical protein n=1 Tax=Acinetobacter baumannii TaxID=470 RepID=UPI001C0C839D|nr:hypothetical protein [Acinetobacter baumannii]MBU3095605.1 hypothetical protein [Acinetobacter baumannii]